MSQCKVSLYDLFGRQGNMAWCGDMQALYLDGTFKQAPPLLHQVYVILGERHGHVFPFFYALLPNKRCLTYQQQFTTMAKKSLNLKPMSISMDYEITALQEAQMTFPTAQIFGCLFHLTRNMKKKLTDEQLLGRYNVDANFVLQVIFLNVQKINRFTIENFF